MSYRIEWSPAVLRRFTAEWDQLNRERQNEGMDALDAMDQQMRNAPHMAGKSRGIATKRILIHKPVAVVYRVDKRLQTTRVVQHAFLSSDDPTLLSTCSSPTLHCQR